MNFWQARGLSAAVTGAVVFGSRTAEVIARHALVAAAGSDAPSDVRSIQLLALVRWCNAGFSPPQDGLVHKWSDEIASMSLGTVLMNSPDERGRPHLWGHDQEVALLAAATTLDSPFLAQIAEVSANELFVPAIDSGFDAPCVQPYELHATILAMDALYAATAQVRYATLAQQARAWFFGRNPAHAPVYDRKLGRVADGIDEGRVSLNSGAEANICGGLALPFVCAAIRGRDLRIPVPGRDWNGSGSS